jgi:hypothetical protein
MFYIVEEESKLDLLEKLVKNGCYVEVIQSNDLYHSTLNNTVAVYIRVLDSAHGYIVPLNHEEGINVAKERIYGILSNSDTLYTLNKKTLLYHFNLQEAIDLSLLYSMNKYERLQIPDSNKTFNWFYSKFNEKKDINRIIPISKLHEKCETTYDRVKEYIELEIPSGFDFYNKLATNIFFLLEQKGVGIIHNPFVELFKPRNTLYNIENNIAYTDYNLYNATSRPTSAFNSINFAAIPKEEKYRKAFKPQNDYFAEFDFDGYHLRLLCDQIGYQLTDESAHKQLAKHYFGTEDINDEQYLEAKQINFQAIYGKIPEKYKHLEIFKLVQEYIDNMWSVFESIGVVCNPQSGKPFTGELKDMHPAKLMNYMMQSLETSNNILILKELLRYLKDKKTFITLYTYDAVLFDFSKEDGKDTLEEIKLIMENKGKFPVKFKYSKDLVL